MIVPTVLGTSDFCAPGSFGDGYFDLSFGPARFTYHDTESRRVERTAKRALWAIGIGVGLGLIFRL